MITQIELDGFKTFKDFKVELGPFQVIVGPNGAGKSNLFDALQLLSRLAEVDVQTAFQELRGEAGELFTKLPNGQTVDRMSIAVEMLVDPSIEDDLGRTIELEYRRLRYELEIIRRTEEFGPDQLRITSESLNAISMASDNWYKKYKFDIQKDFGPDYSDGSPTFFSFTQQEGDSAFLELHYSLGDIQEDQIHVLDEAHSFQLKLLKRTVLSSSTIAQLPSVMATREELRSLHFLHLNPEMLRRSSSVLAPSFLAPDGKNLPTTLARIQQQDEMAFHFISMDMANLLSGILNIRVEKNVANNEYSVWADTADQRSFSAQVLSDGTLRLLALATLRNDPQFRGVLCIEEPDNGVEPLYLQRMARLLHEMATDLNDPEQANEPLRQVLVTTHSPLFISQPEVRDSLLLATMPTRIQGKNKPAIRVTRMDPVITPNTLPHAEADAGGNRAMEAYSIDVVRKYLDGDALEAAQEHLKKARTNLHKR